MAKDTDMTLAELADHVRQSHGLRVAPSTIWLLLDRHDMTFKEKPRTPPNSGDPIVFADDDLKTVPRFDI